VPAPESKSRVGNRAFRLAPADAALTCKQLWIRDLDRG
jgi:hypothetical protein